MFEKNEEWSPIRNILSINVKAATKDNISTLFSSKNVSSEVGLKLKWSFLDKSSLYENDDPVDCNTLKLYRERLEFEYRNMYSRFAFERQFHADQQLDFKDKADKKRDTIKTLTLQLSAATDQRIKDSLIRARTRVNLALQDLFREYAAYQRNQPFMDSTKVLDSFIPACLRLKQRK